MILTVANKTRSLLRCLTPVLAIVGLSGCVVQQPPHPDDPYYAPVMRPSQAPQPRATGSLYSEATSVSLYEDRKARRVGDIITIILSEATTSSKSSNVEVTKDSETSFPIGARVLGTTPSLGEFNLGTDLSGEREFSGEADADQRNNLQGNITVTVVDVYPNGTLAVRGEKWLTLNHGDEYIRISGLVRPDDVSPDNTVYSTKVANARISYSGTGTLADSQQMGWLNRFFNSPLWPF